MKKVILSLSGILVAAFVVVLFVNAQNGPQDVKKAAGPATAKTECAACPSTAACSTTSKPKTAETVKCDPAKCKEMGCDPAKCKEGKCDPATCKAHATASAAPGAGCSAKCPGMAKK